MKHLVGKKKKYILNGCIRNRPENSIIIQKSGLGNRIQATDKCPWATAHISKTSLTLAPQGPMKIN